MKSLVCAARLSGSVIRLGASVLQQARLREVDHVRRAAALEQDRGLDLELVRALEVDLDTRAVHERLPEIGEDLDRVGIVLAVADR